MPDPKRQSCQADEANIINEPLQEPPEHKFWNTQPVPQYDETVMVEGAIEVDKAIEDVRQTPYPLPGSFEWVLVDLENPEQLEEVYTLLSLNYVEDDDATFRFAYSLEFISWALKPPGWKKAWHLGVRDTTNKLVAFIAGIPADLKVRTSVRHLVEISFLCLHKKLRNKRLAPLLIQEITRRVNMEGISQATYTAGVVLPKPIATCRYHHRSLNPEKLVEIGFEALPDCITMEQMTQYYELPTTTTITGLRPMLEQDAPAVCALLNSFLSQFEYTPVFQSDEEVCHYFVPVKDVVYSYVVEDHDTGSITDFISFYSLPSSLLDNPKHKTLNAAYLYYYAINMEWKTESGDDNTLPSSEEYTQRLQVLVHNVLVLAKNAGFDVMNALELMHNFEFVEELMFDPGDGDLNYYLYNWRCPPIKNEEMALIML
ncbi:glycylpeptide N-tetradecanoyltransferase 2-like protein [Basidiobolus meristosporus CBS 931.73]|uniref:Glycylpeptide N-tetradecanoyltransferase n=1 Tax=Basidiobolus meristosporus CBS 931.73 TaxID=1314790 RepID=A0A1Y1Y2L8_9FUNG|nr:glycylpeptide N-tetradecanoyltransferase 2-like protein [Basidiobolus meristosporus CBS 931.73]|eukprot:ORX92262.1 glycylpeptide N-tetradecanoyltransferase 2-like protein [Basidiobolus meristosporus CBS 931.73]